MIGCFHALVFQTALFCLLAYTLVLTVALGPLKIPQVRKPKKLLGAVSSARQLGSHAETWVWRVALGGTLGPREIGATNGAVVARYGTLASDASISGPKETKGWKLRPAMRGQSFPIPSCYRHAAYASRLGFREFESRDEKATRGCLSSFSWPQSFHVPASAALGPQRGQKAWSFIFLPLQVQKIDAFTNYCQCMPMHYGKFFWLHGIVYCTIVNIPHSNINQ